jgi:hypothetical protein
MPSKRDPKLIKAEKREGYMTEIEKIEQVI